ASGFAAAKDVRSRAPSWPARATRWSGVRPRPAARGVDARLPVRAPTPGPSARRRGRRSGRDFELQPRPARCRRRRGYLLDGDRTMTEFAPSVQRVQAPRGRAGEPGLVTLGSRRPDSELPSPTRTRPSHSGLYEKMSRLTNRRLLRATP